jgi:hypothetical protein
MGALKVWDGAAWQIVSQQGVPVAGLPAGGAVNSLLAKQSTVDGDAAWTTAPVVSFINVLNSVTFGESANVVVGTTTGTKFGTSTVQKLAFWNATPVVQSTGWTVTAGYTTDKAFNPASTTINEIANVLGTLIDQLKTYGILGA